MRRSMFLLSLIAALAGTPLRQAEAAHDLACSLAEFGGGDTIDEVDGGVGDDSGATIKSDITRASAGLAAAGAPPAPIILARPPQGSLGRGGSDPSPHWPADSTQRHALLQCFLF